MNQIDDEAFPMLSFIGYRKHLVFDKKYFIKVYENRMTMGEVDQINRIGRSEGA